MALPPRPAPAPLSQAAQLDALEEARAAAAAELERCLDASLAGKRPVPGDPVVLLLPVGDHEPEVLTEVSAHYHAAGWTSAVVDTP